VNFDRQSVLFNPANATSSPAPTVHSHFGTDPAISMQALFTLSCEGPALSAVEGSDRRESKGPSFTDLPESSQRPCLAPFCHLTPPATLFPSTACAQFPSPTEWYVTFAPLFGSTLNFRLLVDPHPLPIFWKNVILTDLQLGVCKICDSKGVTQRLSPALLTCLIEQRVRSSQDG
jgi:hypothetical protein